jgi:hypothetical protein
MVRGTGADGGQPAPASSGWSSTGIVSAYAAGIAGFGYALMSLYWALGGRALISTVGGYVEQLARQGGAAPVLVALAAVAAKVIGGLLALGLVRPWGRVVPRRLLLIASAGASVVLVAWGGLNVLAGALVLTSVIHPAGSVDRSALRWHVAVWDLWFLVWGILLALATVAYWRRTASGALAAGLVHRIPGNQTARPPIHPRNRAAPPSGGCALLSRDRDTRHEAPTGRDHAGFPPH